MTDPPAVRAAAGTLARGDRRRGIAASFSIAENLARADLTELERRQHLARRALLTAQRIERDAAAEVSVHRGPKLPQTGVGRGVGGGRPESGISAAARELGIAETTVKRAVAAESLPDPVKAAADAAGLGTVKRAADGGEGWSQ